jgi:hypothetical protein
MAGGGWGTCCGCGGMPFCREKRSEEEEEEEEEEKEKEKEDSRVARPAYKANCFKKKRA